MSRRSACSRMAALSALVLLLLFVLAVGLGPAMASDTGGSSEDATHEVASHDAADSHDAAHGGVSEKKFWDFIWRVLNFSVLVVALFFVLRKPVAGFFAGRRAEIAQSLEDFERKRVEAEAKFKELESRLSDLTADREKVIAEYIQEGEDEREKIIANAHALAERIKVQAEATIDQEIKAAKTELVKEIADMSSGLAERLIRKNINDQDQERLVEEYLSKVVRN